MSKALVIKGADFSANAVAVITTDPDEVLSYAGPVNMETPISIGFDLLTTFENWTMFFSYSNITALDNAEQYPCIFVLSDATYGDLRLMVSNPSTGKFFHKFCKNAYYNPDGVSYVAIENNTGKVGIRRNGNVGQITFDGVTWQNTNIVLPASMGDNVIGNSHLSGNIVVRLYNKSDKDISSLFD